MLIQIKKTHSWLFYGSYYHILYHGRMISRWVQPM